MTLAFSLQARVKGVNLSPARFSDTRSRSRVIPVTNNTSFVHLDGFRRALLYPIRPLSRCVCSLTGITRLRNGYLKIVPGERLHSLHPGLQAEGQGHPGVRLVSQGQGAMGRSSC